MQIKSVFDKEFSDYGKIVTDLDFSPLLTKLCEISDQPADSVIYIPSEIQLESLPVYSDLQNRIYGGMPIQIGYCNGHNNKLNCVEYHRDSEVNITVYDVVFLLGKLQDVENGTYETSKIEAFLIPAGTAVQLYETTLHYAPCTPKNMNGFRVVVVLPKGTNTDKPDIEVKSLEDSLLWAKNKWLIAHSDSDESAAGAHIGLIGPNTTLE
jgi:hypothetical protein